MEISADFMKCIETSDKDLLKSTLRAFNQVIKKYNFDKLAKKIDEWEDAINKAENFEDLGIGWESISRILTMVSDETNRNYNQTFKSETNNLGGKSNEKDSKPIIDKNSKIKSNESHKNQLLSPKVIEEDNSFLDLKPIKFDVLYKQEMTSEQLIEEIAKINSDNLNKLPMVSKTSSMRQLKGAAMIDDTSYPFKSNALKFDCSIF